MGRTLILFHVLKLRPGNFLRALLAPEVYMFDQEYDWNSVWIRVHGLLVAQERPTYEPGNVKGDDQF
jgi:hypothetical protein